MYEEPYRWVEAVGNRRHYLDDQLRHGAPIVAISYVDGIILLTFSRGTPKLYEIYDRLTLGGMGHPADLEKLRFHILDMAHLEGFQRSPSDVTGSRLMKYGLAPVLKQAYEEIYKAPYIIKLLLAELGTTPSKDTFFAVDYDGSFEETSSVGLIAPSMDIHRRMAEYCHAHVKTPPASLSHAFEAALQTWGIGALMQQSQQEDAEDTSSQETDSKDGFPDKTHIIHHIQETMSDKQLECAVLERHSPGTSAHRHLSRDETQTLLSSAFDKTDKT